MLARRDATGRRHAVAILVEAIALRFDFEGRRHGSLVDRETAGDVPVRRVSTERCVNVCAARTGKVADPHPLAGAEDVVCELIVGEDNVEGTSRGSGADIPNVGIMIRAWEHHKADSASPLSPVAARRHKEWYHRPVCAISTHRRICSD
jgi:hypothetical protein